MKVTQTIQLEDEERLAIQKVLRICDKISDIAHCSMSNVFEYLTEMADIDGDCEYSMGDTLYIAEISRF